MSGWMGLYGHRWMTGYMDGLVCIGMDGWMSFYGHGWRDG